MDGRPGTRVEGGWGFEGAPHGGGWDGGCPGGSGGQAHSTCAAKEALKIEALMSGY